MGGENQLGRCTEGILENSCEKNNSLMHFLSHTGSEVQGVGGHKVKVARESTQGSTGSSSHAVPCRDFRACLGSL